LILGFSASGLTDRARTKRREREELAEGRGACAYGEGRCGEGEEAI